MRRRMRSVSAVCPESSTVAVAALLLAVGLPATSSAGPCGRLSEAQRKLAQQIFSKTHPYSCCDETLARCLKQRKVCKIVTRLRDYICRRVHRGDDAKKIDSILARRARSMTPMRKRATFDLRSMPAAAGKAGAPVQVVVYACARCPYCGQVVPNLYRLATASGLKGKIDLHFRPFPLRGHGRSVEGGLAFVAASRQKKMWPYLLKFYSNYSGFSVDKLGEWAAQVGLDRKKFDADVKDPKTREALVEAKKEGLRNKVDATPTMFINGRKYFGELDRDSLLDVLDEEHDRVSKQTYCDSTGKHFPGR